MFVSRTSLAIKVALSLPIHYFPKHLKKNFYHTYFIINACYERICVEYERKKHNIIGFFYLPATTKNILGLTHKMLFLTILVYDN